METIIKGYVEKFLKSFGLDSNTDNTDNFEKFCSYVVFSNELPNQSINIDDIENTSAEKNQGIDSIGFIVNGKLVNTKEEIEDLKESGGRLDITVIFIQSKTSENFENAEIANFCDTIKDFLSEEPQYPMTNAVQEKHEILLFIYSNLVDIRGFNGKASFCTTGKWQENIVFSTTIRNKEIGINDLGVFKKGKIIVEPFDAIKLRKLYDKTNQPLNAEFIFENKVEIKQIESSKVQSAFYGLLPFKEFKNILIDQDSGKIRSLFYDNVRDDLGERNPVNSDIDATLTNKKFSSFPLLNNGITIIAENNQGTGSKFILENFQIVNGCQTSNVLYKHKDDDDIDELNILMKLIITSDEDIKNETIIATNNQTQIKEEQLIALTEFQKGLEEFYKIMSASGDSDLKLYYERRVNQYAGNTAIMKKSIVDLREQIKTFASVFLEEPHDVSGYFGKIYKKRKNDLFLSSHKHEPYYFSGLISYVFKGLLTKKDIDRKYNKARYHLFMLFRKIHEPSEFKADMLKNKKIISYSNDLIEILKDESKAKNGFDKACEIIDKSGINIALQKEFYKKSTTNILLETFNKEYK